MDAPVTSVTLIINNIMLSHMTPTFIELQKTIAKSGRLMHSRSEFIQRKGSMFGKSDLTTVGSPPPGFGPIVQWKPEDQKIAVVLFLSAADFLGAMITGVTRFDTIEIVQASGRASFSEDTENEGIASLISVVATGASITAGIFGAPEIVPLIKSAEEFAKTQFKEERVRTKVRNAFGLDPGSGHKARQEGGVVIGLPNGTTMETFYSGDDPVENERWIKKPGDRVDTNLPNSMKGQGAFFLQSGILNKRQVRHDGDILIYPWDWKFEDNFGFYRLHIILERHDQSISDEDVE
jgi:hypothetical protein